MHKYYRGKLMLMPYYESAIKADNAFLTLPADSPEWLVGGGEDSFLSLTQRTATALIIGNGPISKAACGRVKRSIASKEVVVFRCNDFDTGQSFIDQNRLPRGPLFLRRKEAADRCFLG